MADENLTGSFDSLFDESSSDEEVVHTIEGLGKFLLEQNKHLENIESALGTFSQNYSQAQAQDFRRSSRLDWRNVGREDRYQTSNQRRRDRSSRNTRSFSDGLEEVLLEALGVSDLQENIRTALSNFSTDIGVELEDLPHQFGRELGQRALSALGNTDLGQSIGGAFNRWRDQAVSSFRDAAVSRYAERTGISEEEIRSRYTSQPQGHVQDLIADSDDQDLPNPNPASDLPLDDIISDAIGDDLSDFIRNILNRGQTTVAAEGAAGTAAAGAEASMGAAAIDAVTTGIGTGLAEGSLVAGAEAVTAGLLAVPGLGEAVAALIAIEVISDVIMSELGDLFESFNKFGEDWGKFNQGLKDAGRRDLSSRERLTKLGNERLAADIESIVKKPYEILEKAADTMVEVWTSSLQTINQTQGYSKAELQDLISSYSLRLQSEGLSDVVSAADFTSNLKKVLESGLSGQAAEEFSYLATKLNAAIPTQDFFNYSSTYASLAANAIRNGQSEAEAIEYANAQLETFASNVLYASRQISGGFSTGLQNASDLFQKAAEIAVASRTDDSSQIAGVLTSVSAITGAIAPDLASSMIDAIYNAAVGGNTSQIVALRSLAGINASNTEFLQQFVENPQKVFSDLFTKLAELQHMSEANYMEVAEGLSNVFGIDKANFQRVDFSYLDRKSTRLNSSH